MPIIVFLILHYVLALAYGAWLSKQHAALDAMWEAEQERWKGRIRD